MDVSNKPSVPIPASGTGAVTTQARAPVTTVDNTASAAKAAIQQAATDIFQTKSAVSADLQNVQQDFNTSVSQLNQMLQSTGRSLSIGIDKAVGGPVVTVRNSETGEVVRQIPNETVVQLAHSIDAFKGWLSDVRV